MRYIIFEALLVMRRKLAGAEHTLTPCYFFCLFEKEEQEDKHVSDLKLLCAKILKISIEIQDYV